MKDQLSYLYVMLSDAIAPLREDFSGITEIQDMFYRYGYDIAISDTDYNQLSLALAIQTALQNFYDQIQLLVDKQADGQDLELSDFLDVADQAMPVIQLISNFDPGDISLLPEPLNQSSFWEDIAEHLLEDLIVSYLQEHQSGIFALLHLFGVIRFEEIDLPDPYRVRYTRKHFDWDQAGEVLTDPLAGLQNNYHWNGNGQSLEHHRLVHNAARALQAVFVGAEAIVPGEDLTTDTAITPSPDYAFDHKLEELRIPYVHAMNWTDNSIMEVGLSLYPITDDPLEAPNGFLLRPVLSGALNEQIQLNNSFELVLGAGIDAGNAIMINILPSGVSLESGDISLGASIGLRSTRPEPRYIFGKQDTTHLVLNGFTLEAKIAGTPQDPELVLRFAAAAPDGGPGLGTAIKLADADGFLQHILGSETLTASISPEIIWSSKTGIRINGKPELSAQFKVDQKIGPLNLKNIELALVEGPQQTSQSSIGLRTGAEIAGKIGPLKFVVEKIGFQLNLIPYSRQDLLALPPEADTPLLGVMDLGLDFAPPKGIGLELDAKAVSGGGYLFFDSAREQYAGVLQLSFANINMQAIGLITTRLPDGSKGFSMVIIISADGFTPVQLGFGFTLVKVGGLLGINRTVDTEVLRQGLKSNTLDSVLFPTDPLANAPRIISDLRSAFPPAVDQYMFGPMVEIVWGQPVMLRMKLGIILEFPSSPRLHILGSFKAGLPTLEEPLVRLNMDALGTIYFDRDELALDAVLYDSKLLDSIALTGGMALRASWGDNPQFILSVGGFNPRFPAPANFPVPDRIAFTLANQEGGGQPNPLIEFKAYFALTSNTAQVGASFYLYAQGAGFSVEGDLRFHALFEFTPFHFIVDIYGAITLAWNGLTLLAVRLDATLSGPEPWYVRGAITLDTFLFDVSLDFEKQFGDDTPPSLAPAADPLPELRAALEDVRNWEGRSPERGRTLVTLRPLIPGENEVLLHPQAELTVRQTLVPLDVEISRYGNAALANPQQYTVDLYLEDGTQLTTAPVQDYFAPAQYREMTDAQKISEPSFEKMNAGRRMVNELLTHGSGLDTTVAYDTLIVGETGTTPDQNYELPEEALDLQLAYSASAQSPLRRQGKLKYATTGSRFSKKEREYRLVTTEDLSAPADAGELGNQNFNSFTSAAAALAEYLELHPEKRQTVQVVAAHLAA